MYISRKWLQNYLPELHQFSNDDLMEILTGSLAEVEEYWKIHENLQDIVVGEVLEANDHPDADKLKVCKVKLSENTTNTIICGAPNVAAGQKVAVCMPGGYVYDASSTAEKKKLMKIESREVRGVESQGMICSPKELGISEKHEGIMVLEPDIALGTNLVDIMQDVIFEIENKSISHRSDAFSHEGIARELSAILNTPFRKSHFEDVSLVTNDDVEFEVDIKVDTKLCPRFEAIVIKDIEVTNSPFWMIARLSAVGLRPINNIVDITNYIMLDKGQPLHAYDYDKLAEKKLVVRMAKDGEEMHTLDNQKHTLSKEMLVVTDGKQAEDIAGVMGGYDTQVTADTKTIVFEAANWNMYNIRQTSRDLGIRTDASTRFEKGLSPYFTEVGIKAATKLLLDISQAEVASELIDYYPEPLKQKTITFDTALVNRFLNLDLSKQDIVSMLENLNIVAVEDERVADTNTNQIIKQELEFEIPLYRMDLNIQHDLLEEIARLYGYSNIEPTLPNRDLTPNSPNQEVKLARLLIETMLAQGADEVKTYSFVGKDLYEKCSLDINKCLSITNPISPENSHVRNTLIPSLMEAVYQNAKDYDDFCLFELNRVIFRSVNDDNIHHQPKRIGAIEYRANSELAYYDLKGKLEALLAKLNIAVSYEEIEKIETYPAISMLHPHRATLVKTKNDQVLGYLGEISPVITDNMEVSGRIAVFELDFSTLLSHYHEDKLYKQLSPFQAAHRDISFWVNSEVKYQQITNSINKLNLTNLDNIELVDVYQAEESKDKKSITISITLQSNDKTLQENEIQADLDKITSALKKNLKAELRQ